MTDEAMAKIGADMANGTRNDLIETLCEDGSTLEYLQALAREYRRLSSMRPIEPEKK